MKKKVFLFIVAIAATTLFNSCEKGYPGPIYFAVNPPTGGYSFTGYDDNNYGFPYGASLNGTYYGPCNPGTYNFTATTTNGSQTWQWTNATYTLYENAGEDWNMFTQGVLENGVDGETRHFSLNFNSSSAYLTTYRLCTPDHPVKIDTTYTCKGGGKMRVQATVVCTQNAPGPINICNFKKK